MFLVAPWMVLCAQSTLQNILAPGRLPYLRDTKLVQISSGDTTGGNNDFVSIAPGATQTLAQIDGPGVIVQFWVTIFSNDKYFLRRLVLRMYWDGEEHPSVEVPIGDFFGTGFEYRHYVTPYLGMSSGGYYSYFPMPFNKSARLEVVNETGLEVNSFYYHIDCQKLSRPLEADVAYFHSQWRREPRTDRGSNYLVLDAEGTGHMVGMNLNMQSYERGLQYLEGDEMVYVDGERKPSLSGTGTEDYFTSGWYFNKGEFAAPYHGLILKDDSLGRIAAYRFHILDAIAFKKSIRFTIEHGDQNGEVADYSSTAYWYQKEPHKPFPPMPVAGMRIPLRVTVPNGAVEAETLAVKDATCGRAVDDMTPYGADWSGNRQLRMSAAKEGDRWTVLVPVLEDRYDLSLYYAKGPEYGDAGIFVEDRKVGELRGYAKFVEPAGALILKDLRPSKGVLPLTFVISGKDRKSSGFAVGLDAFTLKPHRKYIPEWYMIGPFPNPRDKDLNRLGLDAAYPPETEVNVDATYTGVDEQKIHWTLEKTPANGRMDMYQYNPFELVVAYALTYVYSPTDQTLPLLLGSDDGVKVFLNDTMIHRVLQIRIAEPDQDRVPLELKKGWNKLMLKIENNFGGYNFYARILDLDNSLVFSPMKQK